MSLNNFIPTLWAGELLKNLNDAHVIVQCCNRDYQGEIRQKGDTVKINSIGRPTIGTYAKYGDIGAPEELDDSQQILQITEQKFYNFAIDDIDQAQMTPKIRSEAMREAAWALADVADDFVATMLANNVPAANTLTAASVGTGAGEDDMYEILVDLGVILDGQNVPAAGRWVLLAPGHAGLLRKDPRYASFGTAENRKTLSGESVKKVAGFDVIVTNNLPSGTNIIAGYDGAATFAEQIPPTKMEAYRPERGFSDAMKGLHVYGGKVTRPYALAKVVATIV